MLGIGVSEVEVLHFSLDFVQTQLMGQRNIEHLGFRKFAHLAGLWEKTKVAHNLQTVRDLDEGHSRILGVGNDHLAVVFCLEAGFLWSYPGDVVKTFHHIHDVSREFLAEPFLKGFIAP